MKSANQLEIADFQISRQGLAAIVSRQGSLYTWGSNELGQLGLGDFNARQNPTKVNTLDNKRVTAIGLGEEFIIALGLTLPNTATLKLKQHSRKTSNLLRRV
jgi:alpha-tubulin suppressor-like RCC1 family protein